MYKWGNSMTKVKRIFVDQDGVLADFITGCFNTGTSN